MVDIYFKVKIMDGILKSMETDVNKMIEENKKLIYWAFNKYKIRHKDIDEDDLLSIAYYSFYKTIKNFNPERNLKISALYSRVLYNDVYTYLRYQKSTVRKNKYGDCISMQENINNTDFISLEKCLHTNDNEFIDKIVLKDTINRLLKRLNKDEVDVFLLKYNNPELSQYHIADILNVSQPVINKRFKRIKQKYLLESQISL